MKTIQQINKKIDKLKQKLNNIQSTKCEVYTRIVGYYRPLKNWNKGQRKQYEHRVPFKVPIGNNFNQ